MIANTIAESGARISAASDLSPSSSLLQRNIAPTNPAAAARAAAKAEPKVAKINSPGVNFVISKAEKFSFGNDLEVSGESYGFGLRAGYNRERDACV